MAGIRFLEPFSKYWGLMLIATIYTIVPIDSVLYNNVVIYYTANTEKKW